jgi:integrase
MKPFQYVSDRGRRIEAATALGKITPEDGSQIIRYLAEYSALKHASPGRMDKILSHLVNWRRFVRVPYIEASIVDYHTAISALMASDLSANTKHDYVLALKPFLSHLGIPEDQVKKIRVPRMKFDTTTPADILTEDEIVRLIQAARSSRDRALIALVYETGCRIGEAARLRWRDLRVDDHGIGVYITDTKTRKMRYTRCVVMAEYVAAWRADHPAGDEELVFVTRTGEPMRWVNLKRILAGAAGRAALGKRVHWHLLRKSRITHAVKKGIPESVLKKMFWGNTDTAMMRTYVVLSEADIDKAILADAGLIPSLPADDPLRPRTCPHCMAINAPTHPYCSRCGHALDPEKIQVNELIREKIRSDPAGFLEIVKEMLSA